MGVLEGFRKKQIGERPIGVKSKTSSKKEATVSEKEQIAEWLITGVSLYDEGKFEKAIEYYDKILAIEPSWEAWNNKGNALRQLGKFDEALHCLEEALKLNPEGLEAWHGKANVLIDLNKAEEGLSCYDKALKLHPEDSKKAMILSEKGVLLAYMGKERDADECLQVALALNPQNYLVWVNYILT
ncbi:MAG: tetratricopeptide repeat protein [Methanophagales archaeon]|nr:tetratricopeptide repeat protein [Methanophagales archaeon]